MRRSGGPRAIKPLKKSARYWRRRDMSLEWQNMRRCLRGSFVMPAVALSLMLGSTIALGAARLTEAYIHTPMPSGFRVVLTEIDGPVFADASGKTLYSWPRAELRNGATGDNKGESECTSTKTTVNAGLMSPYPAGLLLPDLDQRPNCTQAWPPVRAAANAKPVGEWTIITRKDGIRQWAYAGYALYTSALDQQLGDVIGGSSRRGSGGDEPVKRKPVGPSPDVPSGFKVLSTALGRLVVTADRFSVYVSDHDGPNRSDCDAECTKTWTPILAPEVSRPHGEWSIVERSPGVRQWAFRKQPLYRYTLDYSAHPQSERQRRARVAQCLHADGATVAARIHRAGHHDRTGIGRCARHDNLCLLLRR